jgi:uncharacterized protein (TIGR00299 family) protein
VRAAFLDCQSGASGNMLLGAFLDAGADRGAVDRAIARLGLAEAAALRVETVVKGDREATHVEVEVLRPQPWRSVNEIDRLIAESALDQGVRERSRLAFRLLAAAEAKAHGVDVSRVVLHEAGAVDAVVDVVGTFAAAADLGVEAFYASAMPYCEGTVTSAHGTIALPAPATVNILAAVGAPTYRRDGDAELVTPTGAAIVGACATFATPAMADAREGYGAGSADLPWPNVLRVVVGEVAAEAPAATPGPSGGVAAIGEVEAERGAASSRPPSGLVQETVAVIETNIDDMAPNLLAEIPRLMLEAGALEAFLTPVVMKKGRSAHVVTVICAPAQVGALAERLVRETSTLGVRVREEMRLVAGRRMERMTTSLGEVAVKLKEIGGRVVDATPEHEDVRRLAEAAGMPLTEAQRILAGEARRHFLEQP